MAYFANWLNATTQAKQLDRETLVTIVLAERDDKTEMTFTQSVFESREDRDVMIRAGASLSTSWPKNWRRNGRWYQPKPSAEIAARKESPMQKITTFLWFDTNAEEAARFYTSLFKNSRITEVSHYGDAGPMPAGTAMVVNFELAGQQFMALNGGPEFKFNEAISLMVDCADQAEVDDLWAKLTADGGEEVQCGWVKDKFGLSWQIVPSDLSLYVGGPDAEGSQRAMRAMLQMKKLDIAALKAAYENA